MEPVRVDAQPAVRTYILMDGRAVTVTIERKNYPRYIVHRMTFSEPVTELEAKHFVENAQHFGFNPAGYGGRLMFYRGAWEWQCSNSCD